MELAVPTPLESESIDVAAVPNPLDRLVSVLLVVLRPPVVVATAP
ncbi:hypothetical protein [Caballeronia sp. S22]